MSKLVLGAKIQFRVPGDTTWYDGLLHGIKKGDSNGKEIILGYLVDTGNDARLDEHVYNPRDREISARLDKVIQKSGGFDDKNTDEIGEMITTAITDIQKQKDLPKSETKVERVRQPEQYEVSRDNIRLAE